MTTPLFTKLGLDFDTTKFGIAGDPTGTLEESLQKAYPLLDPSKPGQFSAVLNGDTSGYFHNPIEVYIQGLYDSIDRVYKLIWNASYQADDGEGGYATVYLLRNIQPTINDQYNLLTKELTTNDTKVNGIPESFNTFISHVERMSKVKTSNKGNRPDYNTARTMTNTLQTLLYQNEKTLTMDQISSVGLGCFTSLFIEDDLIAYRSGFYNAEATLTAFLLTSPTATTSQIVTLVNTVFANFLTLADLLVTRREHDENFYLNAKTIMQDLNTVKTVVSSLANINGNDTESFLVKKLINPSKTTHLTG